MTSQLLEIKYQGVQLHVDVWIDKAEPGKLDEVVVDDIRIAPYEESQFWLYESAGQLEKISEVAANQWEAEKEMLHEQELDMRAAA